MTRNYASIAAGITVVGFFLPWISVGGASANGLELAKSAGGLWILPAAMAAALFMLQTKKAPQDQANVANVTAGSGGAAVGIMLYYILKETAIMKVASIGLYASFIGAAAVAYLGYSMTQQLKSGGQAPPPSYPPPPPPPPYRPPS